MIMIFVVSLHLKKAIVVQAERTRNDATKQHTLHSESSARYNN